MTKQEFLSIRSYEEYDQRRSEVKGLDFSDQEIRDHINFLFGKGDKELVELAKKGIMIQLHKK